MQSTRRTEKTLVLSLAIGSALAVGWPSDPDRGSAHAQGAYVTTKCWAPIGNGKILAAPNVQSATRCYDVITKSCPGGEGVERTHFDEPATNFPPPFVICNAS
jgi:hypothetical protein